MFQFIGYNFFGDVDSLNYAPTAVENIVDTKLTNAIYDHFNVTRNVGLVYDSNEPTWDFDTYMDATFNGNVNAGNIDFLVEQISAIKVKRRKFGTFDWITLRTIPVETAEDLTFAIQDFTAVSNTEYEYALVPVFGGFAPEETGTEGQYIIESILAKFNGVYIGDSQSVYKLLYDVNYGTNKRNQQVGTFEPLGQKYPILIANGVLSYDSGTVSAAIINDDVEETGVLDVEAMAQKKERMKDFLTNHKPKLLRDWNGSVWLVFIVDSPQITYAANSGMRVPYVTFNWVEIGEPDNALDLYKAGLAVEVN